MPVVSVSMPEPLLEELNEFIENHGYSGRSEAVREGTRRLLTEVTNEAAGDGETACVVTAIFDHNSGAEGRLSTLRHDHESLVVSNVHSHACDACLELFVVEGVVDEIASFVARLRAVDGVNQVEHSFVSLDTRPPAEETST